MLLLETCTQGLNSYRSEMPDRLLLTAAAHPSCNVNLKTFSFWVWTQPQNFPAQSCRQLLRINRSWNVSWNLLAILGDNSVNATRDSARPFTTCVLYSTEQESLDSSQDQFKALCFVIVAMVSTEGNCVIPYDTYFPQSSHHLYEGSGFLLVLKIKKNCTPDKSNKNPAFISYEHRKSFKWLSFSLWAFRSLQSNLWPTLMRTFSSMLTRTKDPVDCLLVYLIIGWIILFLLSSHFLDSFNYVFNPILPIFS